jgi:two-component system sensor histidine kinase HydH
MSSVFKPWRYAAGLAFSYAIVAGGYIIASSLMAASRVASVEELRSLEILKGVGFVVVTSTLLFFVARSLFGRLTHAIQSTAESREALRHSQRRASVGLFAASVAHDLNNLLSVLQFGMTELAERPEEISPALVAEMSQSVNRASKLATQLMQVGSTNDAAEPEQFDLAAELDEALETLRIHDEVKRRDLHADSSGPMPFRGRQTLVHQLLVNLVLNAVEATEPGGSVRVKLRPISDGAVLEVHDDGPGIPEEARGELFGPFFTTKERGTGLGLVSARACAEEHDGSIEVDDSPLGGACIRVILRSQ